MAGSDGAGVRTRFTQAPGISFVAIATQVGPTRGIEIDNPSGSWLYIPSLETFIPPYTTGWAFGFPYDVASLDVLSRDRQPTGPAGQISTLQGDAVVIYLTDLQLDRKVGVAADGSPSSDQNFITAFTPILTAVVASIPSLGGADVTFVIIAAIPNKRIRLWTYDVARNDFPTFPFRVILRASGGSSFGTKRLWWNEEFLPAIYPQGLDFPVGEGVNVATSSAYGDADFGVTMSYSVI